MYTAPQIIATFDATVVLAEALGQPTCPSFFPSCLG